MQIICNNCGHDLEFQNRQVYVTCPHCYTNLQIEEHDNRIFATIVAEKDIDNSIFQNHELINIDLPNALYDLLHLEGEYTEILEYTAFYAVTQRKKSRPMRFRAIFRFIFFCLISFWFFNGLDFYWNNNGNSLSLFFGVSFFAYAIFLLNISVKEFRKAIELHRFEKYYFKERIELLTVLNNEDLSKSIERTLNDLKGNYEEHSDIIDEFFYTKLFKSSRIKLGAPSISKGLRIFALGIPAGLIALVFGINGYSFAFLFAALAVITVLFGFFVLGDANEYKRTNQLNLTKRKTILEKLRRLMR